MIHFPLSGILAFVIVLPVTFVGCNGSGKSNSAAPPEPVETDATLAQITPPELEAKDAGRVDRVVARSFDGHNALDIKYVKTRMNWGSAYDSVSGAADDQIVCVDLDKTGFSQDPTTGGYWKPGTVESVTEAKVIKTSVDLSASLSMNEHAKMGIGVFKAGEDASWSASAEFSTNRVYGVYHSTAAGLVKSLNPDIVIKDEILGAYDTFDDFVNHCGDYYLFEMETGAELKLMIEIVATDASAAASISGGFSEEVPNESAGGSTNADFKAAYDNSKKSFKTFMNAAIECDFQAPGDTLDGFYAKTQEFTGKLKDCLGGGADASETAAYLASFRKWSRDDWESKRKAWLQKDVACPGSEDACNADNTAQVAAITAILNSYDDYQKLLGEIDNMFNNPDDYEWTSTTKYHSYNVVDAKTQITDPTSGTIRKLRDLAQVCERTPETCAIGSVTPMPETIADDLPAHKAFIPVSCRDYHLQYPGQVFSDREYPLYLNRDAKKPVCAYCYGMATATPKEFLKLYHASPKGVREQNFSAKINDWAWKKHGSLYYDDLISTFRYVPILLRQDLIAIDRGGACNNYVDKDGQPFNENWSSGDGKNNPWNLTCVPFGEGSAGKNGKKTLKSPENVVQVNLQGHPLFMDSTTMFIISGSSHTGSYTKDTAPQSVNMKVVGDNGWASATKNGERTVIELGYNSSLGKADQGLACLQ
ncbi:MAG: hypothetical protein HYT87_03275 [Nitrospirae bacterium]|nr:hypothetical protein [Nitrospirota bacterium]